MTVLFRNRQTFLICLLIVISGIGLARTVPSVIGQTAAQTTQTGYTYDWSLVGDNCGPEGIIEIDFDPAASSPKIEVEVSKCDNSDFRVKGKVYLDAYNFKSNTWEQKWGPVSYSSGDSVIRFNIDPVNEHQILGFKDYRARLLSSDSSDYKYTGIERAWEVYKRPADVVHELTYDVQPYRTPVCDNIVAVELVQYSAPNMLEAEITKCSGSSAFQYAGYLYLEVDKQPFLGPVRYTAGQAVIFQEFDPADHGLADQRHNYRAVIYSDDQPTLREKVTGEVSALGQISTDAYEPDNDFTQANHLNTNGSNQTHTIHIPGDEDWVKFEAIAGYEYTIETFDLQGGADTVLGLFWDDQNDNHPDLIMKDENPGPSRLVWMADQTATRWIKVRDTNPSLGGTNVKYNVKITTKASQGDQYEPDNDFTQAKVIPTDGSNQSHTFHLPGDEDWVKFEAQTGYQYVIETFNLQGGANTVLGLFWDDQNDNHPDLIAKDENPGPSRIAWTADQTATRWIKVRDANTGLSGATVGYSVKITANAPQSDPSEGHSVEPFDETPQTTAQFAQRCLDEINVAGVGSGTVSYNLPEFQNTDYVTITAAEVTAAICDAYRRNLTHIGPPVSGGNGAVHWWLNGQGGKSQYQVQNVCRKDAAGNLESNGSGGCKDDILIFNPAVRTAFLVRDQVWDRYKAAASSGGYDGVLGKLGGPVTDVLNVALDSSKNPKRYEATDVKNDLIGYFEQGELVFDASNGQLFDRTPNVHVYPYLGYRDVTIAHPFGWYVGQLSNELTQLSAAPTGTSSQVSAANTILSLSEESQGVENGQVFGIEDNVSRGQFALWVTYYIYGKNLPSLTGNCPDPTNPVCFADIPTADKEKPEVKAIYMLADDGIIRGATKNNQRYVHPNAKITRGEAMSIVMRALMHPLDIPSYNDNPFSDVPATNKHQLAILSGYHFGIISGYTGGKFKPDESLTYGAAAKILCRAFTSYCYTSSNEDRNFEKKRDREGWAYVGPGIKLRKFGDLNGDGKAPDVYISIIDLDTPNIRLSLAHKFQEKIGFPPISGHLDGIFERKNILNSVKDDSGAYQNNSYYPFVAINGNAQAGNNAFCNSGQSSEANILAINGLLYGPKQNEVSAKCTSFFSYKLTGSQEVMQIHTPERYQSWWSNDSLPNFPCARDNDNGIPSEIRESVHKKAEEYIRSQAENTIFAIGYGPSLIISGTNNSENITDTAFTDEHRTVLGVKYRDKKGSSDPSRNTEYLFLSSSIADVPIAVHANYLKAVGVDHAILLDGGGSSQFLSIGRNYAQFNNILKRACLTDPSPPRYLINSIVAYNRSDLIAKQERFNGKTGIQMLYDNQTVVEFSSNSFEIINPSQQAGEDTQLYTVQYLAHPQIIDAGATLQGTEVSYDLSVWDANNQPAQLQKAYTVNIAYDASALPSNVDETKLALYYWDGTQWQREPTSTVDVEANQITATPQRLGSWAVLAEVEPPSEATESIYLPIVTK